MTSFRAIQFKCSLVIGPKYEVIEVAMLMDIAHYCCLLIGVTFDDVLPRESILNVVFELDQSLMTSFRAKFKPLSISLHYFRRSKNRLHTIVFYQTILFLQNVKYTSCQYLNMYWILLKFQISITIKYHNLFF